LEWKVIGFRLGGINHRGRQKVLIAGNRKKRTEREIRKGVYRG